jgi:CD109 antigen
VFVQTDKSMYKPGDKVRFRVLFLDSYTRPYPAENVKIYVTDGKKNRIKQFMNVKVLNGVYQNELQLSESPVLGNWKIHVDLEDEHKSQGFEVAKYVLPKYEVTVETEPYLTLKDEKIVATVRAKYTYGNPVKGEATIKAYIVSNMH